jgi:hypothetical protein
MKWTCSRTIVKSKAWLDGKMEERRVRDAMRYANRGSDGHATAPCLPETRSHLPIPKLEASQPWSGPQRGYRSDVHSWQTRAETQMQNLPAPVEDNRWLRIVMTTPD